MSDLVAHAGPVVRVDRVAGMLAALDPHVDWSRPVLPGWLVTPDRASNRPQRTRAAIAADRLSLTAEERHDLAGLLVDHHGSWRHLHEQDARRVADALDAFLVVQALLMLRRTRPGRRP